MLILYVASVNAISKSRRGLFNVIHENESSPQSIDSRLKKDAFSSLKSELESQGQIIANPNPYFNLDDLTVSWNDISCPNNGDWIGVFVPELYRTDSASDVGYIDWQYVSDASPSTYLQGYGSMTFPKAMNLRNYIEFRYFSKNSTCGQKADATWSLISTSDKVNPVDLNEPTQLHLSIGNHYTTMVLSFVTNAPQNATLYYGTSPSNLNNKAVGTFTSYSADMMCATPATYTYAPYFCDPGYLHAVSMVDLHPRQTYYYQAQAGGSMSPIYNFTSAPVAGSEDIVKMFAFGDMGGHQTGTQGTLDKLRQHIDDYDIVLHIGDIR